MAGPRHYSRRFLSGNSAASVRSTSEIVVEALRLGFDIGREELDGGEVCWLSSAFIFRRRSPLLDARSRLMFSCAGPMAPSRMMMCLSPGRYMDTAWDIGGEWSFGLLCFTHLANGVDLSLGFSLQAWFRLNSSIFSFSCLFHHFCHIYID